MSFFRQKMLRKWKLCGTDSEGSWASFMSNTVLRRLGHAEVIIC